MADNGADKEAESVYKEFGLDGLKRFMDDQLNAWSKESVKIAVTGQSGSGKSSLINRLRGFDSKDKKNPLYAAVGVTEQQQKSGPSPQTPFCRSATCQELGHRSSLWRSTQTG